LSWIERTYLTICLLGGLRKITMGYNWAKFSLSTSSGVMSNKQCLPWKKKRTINKSDHSALTFLHLQTLLAKNLHHSMSFINSSSDITYTLSERVRHFFCQKLFPERLTSFLVATVFLECVSLVQNYYSRCQSQPWLKCSWVSDGKIAWGSCLKAAFLQRQLKQTEKTILKVLTCVWPVLSTGCVSRDS